MDWDRRRRRAAGGTWGLPPNAAPSQPRAEISQHGEEQRVPRTLQLRPEHPQPSPQPPAEQGRPCTGAQLSHALALGTSLQSPQGSTTATNPAEKAPNTEITPHACYGLS